jgi:hypothetical protein
MPTWWTTNQYLRYRLRFHAVRLFKVCGILFVGYLFGVWAQRQTFWRHAPTWTWPTADGADSYQRAYGHALNRLRGDRRVRLIAYRFPNSALKYQQNSAAGAWRLQSNQAFLPGIAVPREFASVLDEHGVIYIDPLRVPDAALANPETPLKVEVLRKAFVLVPDVSGGKRWAYRIATPRRMLGSRR